jgi:hypothetical protein
MCPYGMVLKYSTGVVLPVAYSEQKLLETSLICIILYDHLLVSGKLPSMLYGGLCMQFKYPC